MERLQTDQKPGLLRQGMDHLLNWRSPNKTLSVLGSVGALAAGGLVANRLGSDDDAYGQAAATNNAVITSFQETSFFTFAGAQHSESDLTSGKITFLSNVSAHPMPKKWVDQQKRAGNCHMVGDGTDMPVVYTQGHNVNNMSMYGRDTRRSLVCNGIRVACRNRVLEKRPSNTVPGTVIWVKSFANAKIKLHSEAHAEAQAVCHTPDNTASAAANGRGDALANEEARLKIFAKTKGAALVKISGTVAGNAKADAKADAWAKCSETSTSTTQTTSTSTTTTTTTIPKPQRSITGHFVPPMHVHVDGEANLCTDQIQASENDPVDLTYTVIDNNGNPAGQQNGAEFTQPDGSRCVRWIFPSTPQNVIAFDKLTDRLHPDNTVTYSDNIPVEPQQR